PLRFHHMLRVFKPGSPMSLWTWFLAAFSVPLTAAGALDVLRLLGLLPADGAVGWIRMALVVIGMPFAFGTAAYKGVLFSTPAQPGWRDARGWGASPVGSAGGMGPAGLLALAALTGPEMTVAALRPAAGLLLAVSLVPLAVVTAEMRTALARRYSRGHLAAAGALVYVGGVLVPGGAVAGGGTGAVRGGAAVALAGRGGGRWRRRAGGPPVTSWSCCPNRRGGDPSLRSLPRPVRRRPMWMTPQGHGGPSWPSSSDPPSRPFRWVCSGRWRSTSAA